MKKRQTVFTGKGMTPSGKPSKQSKKYNASMAAMLSAKEMSAEQEKAAAAKKEEPAETPEEVPAEPEAQEPSVPSDLAKTTKLVFFRKYDTYQALLEVLPAGDLPVKDCFSKVVLYIMRWFRNRLGEEVYDKYPEISFLKTEYPQPENYADFDIEKTQEIDGLNFLDLETDYAPRRKAWTFRLEEPDNGQEQRDIAGRTFRTEICVYLKDESVVLGIRESCREPEANTEIAAGYRPGFLRDMFYDPDLLIGEQGLGRDYAFGISPLLVNGKSKDSCEQLYSGLIGAETRQMPILFVPDTFYQGNRKEVDEKTASLLGYCHVLVWEKTCRKLFSQMPEGEDFAEVAEDGQLIFYRTNRLQEYPTDYFEPDTEGLMSLIKKTAQAEPIRKRCDFGEYAFETEEEEPQSDRGKGKTVERTIAMYAKLKTSEIARLRQEVGNLQRDNDTLHRKNEQLDSENKRLDGEIRKNVAELGKRDRQIEAYETKLEELQDQRARLEALKIQHEQTIRGQLREERKRILPLVSLPQFDKDRKQNILSWIREYYADTLIVHPDAEKSFEDDKRNIDWHKFCMMIHYLSGYTGYRNDGGTAQNPDAAREYDPEEAAYTVEFVSSGTGGALELYKDKYTVYVTGKGGKKEPVLLDLHLKSGKGMDADMIRIYFHYDPDLKKSIIGHMPGHLPTRKDAH